MTSPELLAQDRTLRAMMSVVADLTVERDEQGLLRSTLEHVVQALALAGGITFLADDQGQLEPAAEHRLPSPDRPKTLELALAALASRRPLLSEIDGGGWLAAAPLASKDRVLGVLTLHDPSERSVAPDVELLEALGRQIGNGLDNARLYAELREHSSRIHVINRLTATLSASLDLRKVMPAFASEIGGLIGFDRLACAFVNESGDYIEVAAHPEGTTWGLADVLPVVGSGLGSVVLNSKPVLQSDLLHEHRFMEDMRLLDEGLRSYVLLPLTARGRSIGVLAFGSRRREAYDEATLARMMPLADALALAFENVRLFQKTRELSITDEVTPLYNFRFFHQILDRELKLVDRYKSVLSLIFVDLDRFKPINDRFGHLRGSRTLREVGFLLRAAVRETDYPARYGGDEFVVILPQTDREAALALAEKLRELIDGHTFLQEEGIDARIGASVGVASYPTEASSKEALIRLADQRMYADKENRKAGR